jgi:GDP-L-fucose synthase
MAIRSTIARNSVTPTSKIYVAGHRGLAGSALVRRLEHAGYRNIVVRTHGELDLTETEAVKHWFATEKPEVVLLAAGKVGGILSNNTYPAEFIRDNLAIQTNVIHEAWRAGIQKLLFLGSSCIYPRNCPQPIKEEYLLSGPLEPTNRPYAIAKISGIEMCWAYNRQYGTRYLCAMPTNLYGRGDNYDLHTAHVLPALMRKFHEAKISGADSITVWGSGLPRREFLYSDDMADACIHLLTVPEERLRRYLGKESPPLVNIGCGNDLMISELCEHIRRVVQTDSSIQYDASKPDGTPQKLLDVSLMAALGWRAGTSLEAGLTATYRHFLSEYANL